MSTPRQILKYTNRRLYDTFETRYITLADLRKLVLDRVEFSVLDRNSHMDITDKVLLQVLVDCDRGSEPVMGRGQLLQMIRSCASASCPNATDGPTQAAELLVA